MKLILAVTVLFIIVAAASFLSGTLFPQTSNTVTLTTTRTTSAKPPPETTTRTVTSTQQATQTITQTTTQTNLLTTTTTATRTSTQTVAKQTLPLSKMNVEVAFPNLASRRPVYLTHADDSTNRIFLVLQAGQILVFPNHPNTSSTEVFLDIRDRVNSAGNEEGLLGLVFDTKFKENGFFYVYYTASPPARSVVSRFTVSSNNSNAAEKTSELVLLEVAQPFSNHNGGNILFGPDGYLYIGLGDGGGAGDPFGHGQNKNTLLGSILRIDVRNVSRDVRYKIPVDNPFAGSKEARPEIWAYGLRNPWRFSFDTETGLFYAADVGQNSYEEVDIIIRGGNYGWNIMEGAHCYPPSATDCKKEGLIPPIVEYTHNLGCSITGGYVYRGSKLSSLYGAYVYGDFCSGRIWALRYDGKGVTEHMEIVDSNLQISSFGVDQQGELYILSFDNKIYRLVP
ncbi:MAG: PQQ-dependent sugar dehydrogenase [Thaumarchaeota archaeon]|nr:PQQ-dependent sugar dehydrogenase [Nitrososphaerota archaeon]